MAMRRPSNSARRPADSDPGGTRAREPGPKFRATVRRDGSVTIPAEVRALMKLDAGGEVEFELTVAGLTLRPLHEGRDPEQWWFWTEPWQQNEDASGSDRSIAEERARYMSGQEFLAHLETIDGDESPKA
ncbi:MAG: AbrB/MazE/SpoVT family DNA-binding domain-containing protein [Tepidiformaceae bacterium]